jgi:uroporphyrinogen III methyltransferase/synthase
MGTRHLSDICDALVERAGRAPDTPAAVIQWISYPRQRTVTGTLADVAAAAQAASVGSPSLLIVGSVVTLRNEVRWYDAQPLFGKRVLVTRPAHQIAATARLLRRRGAEAIPFSTIAIRPPPDRQPVERAVAALGSYDLVAFTSNNGVSWLFRELERQGLDARAFGSAELAAIGPATAAALSRRGLRADIVAERFVAEELAKAILPRLTKGSSVLLPRALVAREALPDLLRAAGMRVDVVPVYQTVSAGLEERDALRELVAGVDVITLTSSSTVEQLCSILGDDAAQRLQGCMLASIGPITSDTAKRLGLTVAVTAEVSTSEGLVDALEGALAESRD